MNIRLAALLLVMLVAASSPACGGDEAATTLQADLAAVVKSGKVEPVNGLTTAGQPDEAAFRVFADNGYRVVIDLRTEGENRGLDEPAVVESLGMKYIQMPIGGEDITFEKARELDELLNQFDEPVLLHCASSNRVGALLALNAFAETGDADLAIEKGRAAGMKSLEMPVRGLIYAEKHRQTKKAP
jgi:uncharacterized protein (TIGR01244 family)